MRLTVASRQMLPTYIALTLAFGINYTFDPFDRVLKSHGLAAPREVMQGSMVPWGVLFLGVAIFLWWVFRLEKTWAVMLGVSVCASLYLVWAGFAVASMIQDSSVSPGGVLLYLFVVSACIATVRSMLDRET